MLGLKIACACDMATNYDAQHFFLRQCFKALQLNGAVPSSSFTFADTFYSKYLNFSVTPWTACLVDCDVDHPSDSSWDDTPQVSVRFWGPVGDFAACLCIKDLAEVCSLPVHAWDED